MQIPKLIAVVVMATTACAASLQCGSCHEKEARSQAQTSMAHAMELPATNSILKSHAKLTFQDEKYAYAIERAPSGSIFKISDGANTLEVPVKWGFGAHSQTYVLEYQGRLYDSRVSYYPAMDGLDLTMGYKETHPATLIEALGRELANGEALECFQCHATNAVADDRINSETLVPGVQCEHCHAGAAAHLAAISKGQLKPMPPNLGVLSAQDISEFCGQCHRSFADVLRKRLFGPVNVRFEPYRLAASKCFDGSDRRISCVACHDPHAELVRDDRTYDTRCLACHTVSAKACRVSSSRCVTCHMQKVDLPGAHQKFTDHYIRIVRPGDPYPD